VADHTVLGASKLLCALSNMDIEQIDTNSNLYKQALDLRYRLFFEEHGLSRNVVLDDIESSSRHYCISLSDDLLAYGRLTELGACNFKISQVVVPPVLQRRGYGKSLLKGIISSAYEFGAKTIELNSQVKAVSLYHSLGFKESGNKYPSKTTGISHVKMVLKGT
jgi:predicted GNAT family N-acyltransferase